MRLRQLLTEERKKMGRDLNHVEDLVLFYGKEGAEEALDILSDLTNDQQHDISIKWDGKVAIFYGRDENGEFAMGTKGNWAKNNPLKSPEQAREYITQGGQGEDWRQAMGQDFYQIFPLLEASVPSTFTGFVMGDLIYSPTLAPKKKTKQGIEFTSNQVTYIVNPNSEIGKRIANTKVGVALHVKHDAWNSPNKAVVGKETVQQLNSDDVLAMGQTYAPHAPKLDQNVLQTLKSLISKHGNLVDELIERKPGLSDIPNILYTYNNQTVRGGGEVSTKDFFNWLPGSKVSANKQAKLQSINEENPRAFPALFELFHAVANAKNDIIAQLDANETDIRAVTDGQPGGEGYVSLKHKVKLVPRHLWKPK